MKCIKVRLKDSHRELVLWQAQVPLRVTVVLLATSLDSVMEGLILGQVHDRNKPDPLARPFFFSVQQIHEGLV